jgi:hypothetical protein
MKKAQYRDCGVPLVDPSLEVWKVKYSSFYNATLGDETATLKVVYDFMDLVHKWAHKYGGSCPLSVHDDLVQEGVIGILTAIKTFDTDKRTPQGKPICPSTWVWWKIRASIQSACRKHHALKAESFNNLGDVCDWAIEDTSGNTDLQLHLDVERLLVDGCGSLDSRRAQIVKDKFGLFGNKPLKQWEISMKYSISKQATSAQIAKFFNKVRKMYPELKEVIR